MVNQIRTTSEKPSDVYDAGGVDLSLIRWTLSITPAERLQIIQSAADSLARMRDAVQR